MPRLLSLVRGIYQLIGLAFVLLAIPLALDVGGVDCGISFTFLLSTFYVVLCTLRLALRRTFLQPLASILYYQQFILIPSMLLLHLSQCERSHPWLDRMMWPWQAGLEYATGVFTILEGFCVLIVVQACGRASTTLARRSDMVLLGLLLLASLMITADLYLLVRIYMFPDIVGAAAATLIGASLSICLSLGIYGIWSRRGNVVESTLLFSYIVYQIYLTFTDFQTSSASLRSATSASAAQSAQQTGNTYDRACSMLWNFFKHPVLPSLTDTNKHLIEPELPPVIIDSLTEFMTQVAELTPTGIKTMVQFLAAASRSITPSICISLVVRLTSYFVAMRLVPYIKHQTPHRSPSRQPSQYSRWLLLAYSYSPVLIIMVYTHLLLQHTGHIVHGQSSSVLPIDLSKIWTNSRQAWQFWGWANIFSLLAWYALELTLSPAADSPGTPLDSSIEDIDYEVLGDANYRKSFYKPEPEVFKRD